MSSWGNPEVMVSSWRTVIAGASRAEPRVCFSSGK